MSLNLLDWIIIVIYLAGMITLSFFWHGGRKMSGIIICKTENELSGYDVKK
jgi:hypothetical protein